MEESLAKVLSFIVLIVLGQAMRRFGILKPEAFSAISGLVQYVTLPAVILYNLNGISIAGELLIIAFLGLATNIVLFLWAMFLGSREKTQSMKDFVRMNVGGYSVGPFAVPYMQAFYPTTGVLTVCMFDVGSCFMSAGGTYAILSGSRSRKSLLGTLKEIGGKLLRSGPLDAFLIVILLSIFSLKIPESVMTCVKVAATANTFLCMIMIGEAIELFMSLSQFLKILKILMLRWGACLLMSVGCFFLLPFDEETRKALAMVCLSPIPAISVAYTAKLGCDIALGANINSLSVAASVVFMSVALVIFGAL